MNFTPDDFETYPGAVTQTHHDRVSCLRFLPDSSGYSRSVTKRLFVPPVMIAGWLAPRESPYDSPGNSNLDGLHVHVGHIGNDRNYTASLVRRDGNAKIAVEYGWRGYTTLHGVWKSKGPEFVPGRIYNFEVTWLPDRITTYVGNEDGVWTMSAKIPKDQRFTAGALGFRLDSLDVLGNFAVREL